jgi:hypothetical protein
MTQPMTVMGSRSWMPMTMHLSITCAQRQQRRLRRLRRSGGGSACRDGALVGCGSSGL